MEKPLEPKLDSWFITGFSDGEASFVVNFQKKLYKDRIKWYPYPVFQITLDARDKKLLSAIQDKFEGVGSITGGSKSVYRVASLEQIINVIIPHFDKYRLITQKYADYLIFKKIVYKIEGKEHLTQQGLEDIVGLKVNLNKGLSEELKKAFPNVVPVKRYEVTDQVVPDPN